MNLADSASERSLRDELRAWLNRELSGEWRGSQRFEVETAWQRRLFEGGWVGVHWPREFGGRGASPIEYLIFTEELGLAGAPEIVNRVGVNLVGPTLIAHGTVEQQARYLRPILSADEIWCQLYSEPGAGSDLASLTTRAERRGEEYVLHGQKVWSSYAQFASFGLALVRTGGSGGLVYGSGGPPERKGEDRHGGISCLLVPMDAPGVEVRPLRQITGSSEFCEVFLDGARVPVENLVGEENGGWRVAMTTLGHERGVGFPVKEWAVQRTIFERVLDLVRESSRAALIRDRVGRAWIDLEVLRLLNMRTVSELAAGSEPGPRTSVTKLHWAGTAKRLTEVALDLLGPRAALDGWWGRRHLWSRAGSIAGGTDEVQRNILAERVLGMPR